MRDLFMCLLLNLKNYGKITAASLYRTGNYSSIELESDDAVYTISIGKEEKKEEVKE